MTRVTSVRLEDALSSKLDALAASTDRSKAWLIEQAIKNYVDEQSGQIEAVEDALKTYRSGKAELVSHEQVMEQLEGRIKAKVSQ
jgi:predicted transcriptional regulator